MITAAAALLGMTNSPARRLLCLASIACNLGSAMGTTALLCCVGDNRTMRLAWFDGGGLFVLALSAPHGWLRWGIMIFLGAVLAFVWASELMVAKILGTVLVFSSVRPVLRVADVRAGISLFGFYALGSSTELARLCLMSPRFLV